MPAELEPDLAWRCYRHPDRDAGVRCNRCDEPICGECMVTAPVGFQCRSCVKAAPPVRTLRSLQTDPRLTWVLIGANVLAFLLTSGRSAVLDFALFGPAVAAGEWWRLGSSGFLHADLLHLGMNMAMLFRLGSMLESSLGRPRLAALYAGSLLAGSLGVLLLDPNALTLGASGAVFGLMGAAVVQARTQGIDVWRSDLGGLLLINLVLTFVIPRISVGGHVGGLVGGGLCALALLAVEDRPVIGTVLVSSLALAFAAASLAVVA